MKRLAIVVVALILVTACQQRTERVVSDTSTTETTTVSATVPQVDTAAVATATETAADAVRDAAHKTGTALEEAGKKIQEKTDTKQ
jgi:PBP1b-binding outer membrane lipoprotein LpoB